MDSASAHFAIPSEYDSQLKLVEPLDIRSDADIIGSLKRYTPVASEKNIWAFWHSGLNSLPAWCLRNVLSWVRINGPTWTVRILDSDPSSPNYLLNYVPADIMPAAISNTGMTGPFVGQHTADFVRSATIYLHGGCFIDVGILLIRRLDRVCWDKLTQEGGQFRVAIPSMKKENIANHFVACRKGDPFIKRWHELMLHLWRDKTESKGTIINSPLLAIVLQNDDPKVREPLGWDFTDPVTILEYVGQILAFQRMCWLDKADEEGFNCARYWAKHVLTWNAMEENWAADVMMRRVGPHPRIMELLATPRDTKERDYEEARELTWRLLTRSSMMKVTSVQGMTRTPHLGVLWGLSENAGKDCAEGTFAELLRYGSVHFEQKREAIEYFEPGMLDVVVNKTLLEA
ncbi:hypothetical protein N0V90_008536 [Kalmusia sp. IMI 367209]|nr:hypothetical protein N0V90_008536 [Kalmusia sp. IMI 367209]